MLSSLVLAVLINLEYPVPCVEYFSDVVGITIFQCDGKYEKPVECVPTGQVGNVLELRCKGRPYGWIEV